MVLVGLLALVMTNCATIPRTEEYRLNQIQIHVQNETHNRATFYLMGNSGGSGGRQRLLSCEGLSVCNYWISERRSQQILDEGAIYIGWRTDTIGRNSDELPGQWVQATGTLNVLSVNRMVVIVRMTSTYTYLYPGQMARQV